MLVDQEQPSSDVLARRRRRARAWSAVTVALHVSTLALTVALLPLGGIGQTDSLVIILTLTAGPPAGMLWVQRRRPSARKPHQWPWRALAVAVPQAMALGELTLAQVGQFTCSEAQFWPFPGARLRIWRGPVLRLVSGRQQWLIPVDAAHEVAEIVRGRATTAPRRDIRSPGGPSSARGPWSRAPCW